MFENTVWFKDNTEAVVTQPKTLSWYLDAILYLVWNLPVMKQNLNV